MALSHMTALAIIIPVYARGFRTLLPESADLFGPRPFGSFPYRIGCSPSMYRLGLAVVLSLDVIDQARQLRHQASDSRLDSLAGLVSA